jgi:hypothetical protein
VVVLAEEVEITRLEEAEEAEDIKPLLCPIQFLAVLTG